jgi:hypothetical protein
MHRYASMLHLCTVYATTRPDHMITYPHPPIRNVTSDQTFYHGLFFALRFELPRILPPVIERLESRLGKLSTKQMSLLANILGFAGFGLAARVGQLGIQKRNLLDSTLSTDPVIPQCQLISLRPWRPPHCDGSIRIRRLLGI